MGGRTDLGASLCNSLHRKYKMGYKDDTAGCAHGERMGGRGHNDKSVYIWLAVMMALYIVIYIRREIMRNFMHTVATSNGICSTRLRRHNEETYDDNVSHSIDPSAA